MSEPLVTYVLAVASTVTAAGVIGVLGYMRAMYQETRQNTRVLRGDEADTWPGLITIVQQNTEALEEEGIR